MSNLRWVIFFSGHKIRDRSLAHRALFEAIPWGIIQAGTWPVFSAAHSDLFGTRPELSARIKSADGFWMVRFSVDFSIFHWFFIGFPLKPYQL